MRPRAARTQGLDETCGTQQVGLGGEIGGVVELDGRRRVDRHVARAQLFASGIAQAEPVAPQVDLDHGELLGGKLAEALLAELVFQAFEGRARKHLALEALTGRPPRAGPDGKVDARDVRDRAQTLLYDRIDEEGGAAGVQEGLPLQCRGDHDRLERGGYLDVIPLRKLYMYESAILG